MRSLSYNGKSKLLNFNVYCAVSVSPNFLIYLCKVTSFSNINKGPSLNPQWINDSPVHSDVEARLRHLLVELGNADKILGIQVLVSSYLSELMKKQIFLVYINSMKKQIFSCFLCSIMWYFFQYFFNLCS